MRFVIKTKRRSKRRKWGFSLHAKKMFQKTRDNWMKLNRLQRRGKEMVGVETEKRGILRNKLPAFCLRDIFAA